MRVVVLGGTGLLGRAVAGELALAGHDVVATGHTRTGDGIVALDARDSAAVDELLRRTQPAAVVNAIGERRPEYWDTPRLDELNVQASAAAAQASLTHRAWLIHVSTDYVFDGTAPPYRPDSPRRPSNAYGAAKARAEDAVRAANPDATVLRVPVLYGPVEYDGESNLTSLLPLVRSGKPTAVDDWAVRYPTFTPDVGVLLVGMLDHRAALAGAVVHWSGDEPLSKYAMAVRIGAALGVDTGHLTADATPSPDRPQDTRLDCAELDGLGIGRRTPLDEGLRRVLRESVNL